MAKDTKEKILDAAEILFSQQGIGATSIRAIIAKADVNIAAIHYHFGCKPEVIKAVYLRRISPINKLRLKMLTELEETAGGNPLAVIGIVSAFLKPAIQQLSAKKTFKIVKGLMGRIHSEPDEVANLKDIFEDIFKKFYKHFSQALPHLTKEELMARFTFMIGAMGIAFLDEHIVRKKSSESNVNISNEDKGKYLIHFVTAGFEAPVTVEEKKI